MGLFFIVGGCGALSALTRQVDWLLRSRRWLRQLGDAVGDGSRSIVLLGPGGGKPDPTMAAGVAREALSSVLDAVDRALAQLPAETRQVVRLRYDLELPVKEVARRSNMAPRTVARRRDDAKAMVARFLGTVGRQRLARFWHVFGTFVA